MSVKSTTATGSPSPMPRSHFLRLNPPIANNVPVAILFFSLAFAVLSLAPTLSFGAPLRHVIEENDSPEAVAMEHVCFSLLTLANGRTFCLPTSYLKNDEGRLELHLALRADQQAFTVANRVLAKQLDKPFLDSLFRNDSFESISGHATLRAIYAKTALSYTPIDVIGAYKLTNPSLPQVHIAGFKESVLRLEHHFILGGSRYWAFLIAPSLYYYQRQVAYLDTDLLNTAVENVATLVKSKTSQGVDADFAFAMLARHDYWPTFAVRLENLVNERGCIDCANRFFDIERYLATRADFSLSTVVPHKVGRSIIGVSAPYFASSHTLDSLKTTVAYAYKLSKMEAFVSFAPTIYTFGFLFDSDVYRLGISYSDEKQDNSIQIARQKQTYVFTSFYL